MKAPVQVFPSRESVLFLHEMYVILIYIIYLHLYYNISPVFCPNVKPPEDDAASVEKSEVAPSEAEPNNGVLQLSLPNIPVPTNDECTVHSAKWDLVSMLCNSVFSTGWS